mgnify:CR=1 FL=1
MLIKVRFLKDGSPAGREYTYESDSNVRAGDEISVRGATAVVTEINVPEEEVASYRDKIKKIDGKVEEV